MGNRAVITTKNDLENNGIGIYLHWNGGRDSVEAFLAYCDLKGYRKLDEDCYGYARLCQVICNFFGGELSVGVDVLSNLDCDNWDNGVYIVEGWEIVGRMYEPECEQSGYDLCEFMKEINKRQQVSEQLNDSEIEDFCRRRAENVKDCQ